MLAPGRMGLKDMGVLGLTAVLLVKWPGVTVGDLLPSNLMWELSPKRIKVDCRGTHLGSFINSFILVINILNFIQMFSRNVNLDSY